MPFSHIIGSDGRLKSPNQRYDTGGLVDPQYVGAHHAPQQNAIAPDNSEEPNISKELLTGITTHKALNNLRPEQPHMKTGGPLGGLGAKTGGKGHDPKYQLAHFKKSELRKFMQQGVGHIDKESGLMKIDMDEQFKNHDHVRKLKDKADYHRYMGGRAPENKRALGISDMAAEGRNGDNAMALVTPHTAYTMNHIMGKKSINPVTGHQEFYDWAGHSGSAIGEGAGGAFGGGLSFGKPGAIIGAGLGLAKGFIGPTEEEKEQRNFAHGLKIAENEKPEGVGLNPNQPGAVTSQPETPQASAPPIQDNYMQNLGGGGANPQTMQPMAKGGKVAAGILGGLTGLGGAAAAYHNRNKITSYAAAGILGAKLQNPVDKEKIMNKIGKHLPVGPNNPVKADDSSRQDHAPIMAPGQVRKLQNDGTWVDGYNPQENHTPKKPLLHGMMPEWIQKEARRVHEERVNSRNDHSNEPYKYAFKRER